MLQENSETLLNLNMLIPAVAIFIGVAILIAAGLAALRYFTSAEPEEDRRIDAKKRAGSIALFAVSLAVLAGGHFTANMWATFTDTGGISNIEQGSNATKGDAFTPQNEFWEGVTADKLPDKPNVLDQAVTETNSHDNRNSENEKAWSSGWSEARRFLWDSGYTTSEEVCNDAELSKKLKDRGVKDFDDPALWENLENAQWNSHKTVGLW